MDNTRQNITISQYLCQRRVENGYSHVSLFQPKGKFLIEDYKEFWTIYETYYKQERLGIAEMPINMYLPVLIDVDLKIEIGENEEIEDDKKLYTMEQAQKLVKIYQEVLNEILKNKKEKDLCCFLLEKKGYIIKKNGKKYFKNGYHVHFPKIFLSKQHQELFLIPRVRMECKKLNSNEIPLGCSSSENMIDMSYCRTHGAVPWLLYGCRKEYTSEPYIITKAFDENGRYYDDWWNVFEEYRWEEDLCWKTREELELHLPQILSIQPFLRQHYLYTLHDDVKILIHDKIINHAPSKPKKVMNMTMNEENYSLLVDLIELLSPERASDRNEWIRVGWTLYNVTDGNEDGLQLWILFSKKCPEKFDENVCIYEWSRIAHRELSLGTLKYMAKQDNPEGYEQVIKKHVRPFLEKTIRMEGTHYDLAKILFQRYENEFTCSSINHRSWYQFVNHTWKRLEDGYTLRNKLSNEIADELECIIKKYVSESSLQEDPDINKKIILVMKMMNKLKTSTFKTHVMKEAMEIFYDETFEKKLDSDPYKIAFSNGIYDLKEHIFMVGKPEHHISLKMNIAYRPDLKQTSEEVQEVISYLIKTFPDEDVREYFINTVCDIFVGGNLQKMVQIWTGDGDNGKSITQSLFEQMLGPYSIKLPTSLITGKRTQSSAACPELVRAGNGVRLAMLQEPDPRDILNIGILKELSGNDTFFARGLYKEGQEITPMFKLVLICNDPPKIYQNDAATWNRIRVIPFEATFTDDAPETFEEQLALKRFPKDKQFKDKIPKMIEALAWYMIERYKVKPKVVIEPEKVLLATSEYRSKNDVAQNFIRDCVDETAEGRFITLLVLYMEFKDWYKESFPHQMLPCKFDLRSMIIKKWGPCALNHENDEGWFNKKLRCRKPTSSLETEF